METTSTNSKSKYWIYFGISAAVTLVLLIFANEWFWAGLPFMLTYLVQAMDKILSLIHI